jgi:hypothetical protein
MATAPTVLKSGEGIVAGPFTMTAADSVDGLLYMPDASGDLTVASGAVLAGIPVNRAKVGDKVSLRFTGLMVLKGSEAITPAGTPVKVDSAGKIAVATVGTSQVIGYLVGPVSTADGDFVTIWKYA